MSYRNQVLEEYGDLLTHQSQIMHRMLMLLTASSSVLFFFVDLFFGETIEAWLTLSILPLTAISFLFYKWSWIYFSKLFNVLQSALVITVISTYVGADGLVFMYIIPIFIASFMLFQGKEVVTAYVVASISFLFLVFCIYADAVWGHAYYNPEDVVIDRYMNIVGVTILTIAELVSITRVSASIQKRLLASSRALDMRNKQLSTTIYTRDRMMSVISHDLRSPVATLDTAADILNAGGLDEAVQKSFFRQFKMKTSHLLILIDQLLDWSRAQTNTIRMNRVDIGLEEMGRYIKGIAGLLSSEKKVKVVVDFNGAENDTVNCDRHMIEGVFRNLISNAVKFSEEGGTVRIYSRKLENGREFIVEDHGRGMTQEQIDNLQQKVSFTTEGTLNEVGHGFGLQLVHEFLEKHGSELKVKSTVGKGSRFSFVL
jgi:signal transduction histidine kinase